MSSPVVLYIDNQPEIVEEARRTIIESLGYTVLTAPNALAAMQILMRHQSPPCSSSTSARE